MNETICNIMLYGGIALALIFAVAAVILFIRLNIPKVIGDLTGRTEKKQIKEIREKGYESVQGSGASKKDAIKVKSGSGKITVRDISESNRESEISRKGNELYQKAIDALNDIENNIETENLSNDYEKETDVLSAGEGYESETNILSDESEYESETDVLSAEEEYEGETDVLSAEEGYEGETDVLSSEEFGGEDSTDILSSDEETTDVLSGDRRSANNDTSMKFKALVDIVVVHTEENI